MSFCTHLMGKPFFSRAIPTYGVLPYSMINPYPCSLLALRSCCLCLIFLSSLAPPIRITSWRLLLVRAPPGMPAVWGGGGSPRGGAAGAEGQP